MEDSKHPGIRPLLVYSQERRDGVRKATLAALTETFPLEARGWRVELHDPKIHEKEFSSLEQKHAVLAGRTLSERVTGTLVAKDASGKETGRLENHTLLHLPYFTPRHTVILDGTEYSTANQLRLRPGVYARRRGNEELEAAFNPTRGSNFRISMDPAEGKFHVEHGTSKIPLYPTLRALGVDHADIARAWGPALADANKGLGTVKSEESAVDKLYRKMLPEFRQTHETHGDKIEALRTRFQESQLDPEVTKTTLGKGYTQVTPEAMLAASHKVLQIHRNNEEVDDRDSLAFKQVHTLETFLKERISAGARALRGKLSVKLTAHKGDLSKALPAGALTKPVHSFFTESALSAVPTQINPLEVLDQAVRVTYLGEGGISSERSVPFDTRGVHNSQLGILDPARTPESGRAGIDIRTTISTRHDAQGNMHALLRDVKTGKEVPVAAHAFNDLVIAFPGEKLTRGTMVDAMRKGRVERVPVGDITHQVTHLASLYGPTTNLLPFHHSMQGNRVIMASKHQAQALPLVDPEAPLVQVRSWNPLKTVGQELLKHIVPTAQIAGTVVRVDDQYIHIKPDTQKRASVATKKLNGDTFYIDRPKGTVKHFKATGSTFTYPVDYGYVPGYKGEDGEGLDIFVGDDPNGHYESFMKMKPGPGGKMVPDETKYLAGVTSAERDKLYTFFSPQWRTNQRTYQSYADMKATFGMHSKHANADHVAAELPAIARIHYDTNFPLAAGTFLHNNVSVKVGDRVTAGQQLADSNFAKDGHLAIGKNLRVGYMAYRGLNSNDALVMSQTGADKMTSVHMHKVVVPFENGLEVDGNKHRAFFGAKYESAHYNKLDDNGVIKPGTKVNPGDMLVAGITPTRVSAQESLLGKISKSLLKPWRDEAHTWDHDHPGEVVDVVRTPGRVALTVKTTQGVVIGDKFAGTHGNKGVVAKIIPDDQMPHDEKGRPLELLFTSAGINTRVNPSQILETLLGKVAEHTGKPIVVDNSAGHKNTDFVRDLLKQHGLKDTETVHDPVTGKNIHGVATGKAYILKLFKTTDSNWSAHATDRYDANDQPARGGDEGAKAIGKMEFDGLVAHNARNVLREAASIKGQRNDEFWRSVQLGLPTPAPKTSLAYDKFLGMLHGAGIKVDKTGSRLALGPLTDGDITRMSSGALTDAHKLIRAKDLKPELGGLFDPLRTGGEGGTKWSHADLAEAVVNPTFEEPVRRLLGLTQTEFDSMHAQKGGEHFRSELSKINLPEKIRELRASTAKLNGPRLDNVVKQIKYLEALQAKKLRPENAYVLTKIPVIPPILRPILPLPNGTLQVGDANLLYRDAFLANKQFKDVQDVLPNSELAPLRQHLYEAVGAVFGTHDPVSQSSKGRGAKGYLNVITGSRPGAGFFQNKIMKRQQDISGRATIAPDPTLSMDEVGIPEDMLWKMYSKFVVGRLVKRGRSASEAQEMVERKDPVAREELLNESRLRPVIINRAPSLHKHNLIGAYAKMIEGKTIRLNPFAEKGMNADHDGDAIQVHAPVTMAGIEDVKRMTLSNQIFTDRNRTDLNVAPQQEAVIGLHRATQLSTTVKSKSFNNKEDALAAYHRGEISLADPVKIG